MSLKSIGGVLLVFTIGLVLLSRQTHVAFVGCPADGMSGPLEPPHAAPKVIARAPIAGVPDDWIAYYLAGDGPGLFAPSGWHCRMWYGSSGLTLVVTPAPIENSSAPFQTFRDQAVELSFTLGGTSGRIQAAGYSARLFPEMSIAFRRDVRDFERTLDTPMGALEFDGHEYVGDTVKRLSPILAEFTTPANATGLGTGEYLAPSALAIHGVAFYDDREADAPNVTIVSVRLAPEMSRVEAAILRLNRECIQRKDGC